MSTIDPSRILGYGAVGLGFLLAFLSYLLLAAEGKREGAPRPSMLTAIYVFMAFAFSLSVLGFASEYVRDGRGVKNSSDGMTWLDSPNALRTAAGDTHDTEVEIENILTSSVLPTIRQKCLLQPDREFHAVVRVDMHKGDAKNDGKFPAVVYMGGSSTNFDEGTQECVRAIIKATAFPECLEARQPDPDDPPDIYWFAVKIWFHPALRS